MTAEKNLFDVQPQWCRNPLVKKEELKGKFMPGYPTRADQDFFESVLYFDPGDVYQRIHEYIDPFGRWQGLAMERAWPNEKGICACGCGAKLTGTRWNSQLCNSFAYAIVNIINCDKDTITRYLNWYQSGTCIVHGCNVRGWDCDVDHLHAVAMGGGGGWLSNYQR